MSRPLKLVLSLAVTAAFSWWAFHDTDWAMQSRSLRSANYAWLIPYLVVLLLIYLCRTIRWGCLLSGMAEIPFVKLNEASGIGFMLLLVLPFRLGEFARPFLIARRTPIRKSAAMTTVVFERIVDGVFVAVALRILLFAIRRPSQQLAYVKLAADLMFGIFMGGFLFLLVGLWQQKRTVALVRATLGRWFPHLAERVAGMVDTFVGAMRQLPRPPQLAAFFILTLVYWLLTGWGMKFLTNAFGFHLSLFEGYVVMCVLVVGVMIPAAPGMVGTFQAAIKIGLSLFLPAWIVNGQGLAYANVMWLCQTLQQILLGLLLLGATPLSLKEIAGKLSEDKGLA